MMATRRSSFSGEVIQMPAPKPAIPALSDQLADLRVKLATETARREAAEARCADLEARLMESDQRAERIASDLERAHGRIESLASVPASSAAPIIHQDAPAPVAYDAVVTKRDVDGKLARVELIPRSEG